MDLRLLLADDDDDDCLFFKQALEELPIDTHLTTVQDGEQLMNWLATNIGPLPDALFLDLNMPRKGSCECLVEIKADQRLRQLPVIILSASFEKEMADRLYKKGATSCILKPADFSQLKQLIQQTLSSLTPANVKQSVAKAVVRG
ncbi:MAG: response regulator [Rudanella sp.]|nr:response regulator [Rudanella sp.]